MPTIFLSYSRRDTTIVHPLVNDLRVLGNTVWFDEEVSGGQAWWDHILEQIRTCDVFVFALSPDALDSLSCRQESEYATTLGKPILPIWLTGDDPRNRLSPALATIQYVDYRERTPETSFRLSRALNHLPLAPPLPEPLPKPPDVPISYINRLRAQITGDELLNDSMQSDLVLELRRSLDDPEMAEDARDLLTRLRGRRDLLARIAQEIDEALGNTSHTKRDQSPSHLRTILLTVATTVVCLGLVAFLFRESIVDFVSKEVKRDDRLKLAAVKQERDVLQRRVSELESQLKAKAQKTISSPPDKFYKNSIGMEFVLIPKGTFQMGSDDGDDDEKPIHQVTISQPFYLGKHEVTQGQWEALMEKNPSNFSDDPNRPVENVSWHAAQEFIEKLNQHPKEKEEGHTYRLPTEAEWEYAARAGTITAYSFGNDPGSLSDYGWYDGNSDNKTHPVGQLKANPWGLYDMHGNVWEWVEDWYAKPYPSDPQTDPNGPQNGDFRVLRGGSFRNSPVDLRSAVRVRVEPELGFSNQGFRCVRVPPSLNP